MSFSIVGYLILQAYFVDIMYRVHQILNNFVEIFRNTSVKKFPNVGYLFKNQHKNNKIWSFAWSSQWETILETICPDFRNGHGV